MRTDPWYARFEYYRDDIEEKKHRYTGCSEGIPEEVRRDLISRVVKESNWTEGLQLSLAETRELANSVFDDPNIPGPHLDMNAIVTAHKRQVVKLRRKGRRSEQIAAFNLARAHVALEMIFAEFKLKTDVAVHALLRSDDPSLIQVRNECPDVPTFLGEFEEASDSEESVPIPLRGAASRGGWIRALQAGDLADHLQPMREDYIHFLHQLTTMGLLLPGKCGTYRTKPAHIFERPELPFPSHDDVRDLVVEFCKEFPSLFGLHLRQGKVGDVIAHAARASHRFVAIHPYADGNGRVSRLLMNLVLMFGLLLPLPVYLKADRKGRHRYHQALKRADRGDYSWFNALIALSLSDVYDSLLASVKVTQSRPG